MMRKKLIIIPLICSVILVNCTGCKTNKTQEFWKEKMPDNAVSVSSDNGKRGFIPTDETEYNNGLVKLYGEIWHSDNYRKDEIVRPKVISEETVSGEYWFPPINNTAPLEDIAPVISYELACDGYNISTYYPDNPEDFTAQALNGNAFPITFFRKVNDLCYYTVCKVEGGGYMYYFFLIKSGNTPKTEDEINALSLSYLYDVNYADIEGIDITKDAVWRASVYSVQDLGYVDDFDSMVNDMYRKSDWHSKDIKSIQTIDRAAKMQYDCIPALMRNALGDEPESLGEGIAAINRVSIEKGTRIFTKHLCRDGIVFLEYGGDVQYDVNVCRTKSESLREFETVVLLSGNVTGIQNGSSSSVISFCPSSSDKPFTEDNSVVISILENDYMW